MKDRPSCAIASRTYRIVYMSFFRRQVPPPPPIEHNFLLCANKEVCAWNRYGRVLYISSSPMRAFYLDISERLSSPSHSNKRTNAHDIRNAIAGTWRNRTEIYYCVPIIIYPIDVYQPPINSSRSQQELQSVMRFSNGILSKGFIAKHVWLSVKIEHYES